MSATSAATNPSRRREPPVIEIPASKRDHRIAKRCSKRRYGSEDDRTKNREDHAEGRDRRVERDLGQPRQSPGRRLRTRATAHPPNKVPRAPPIGAEQPVFDEQLPEQSPPTRAKRRADRHVPRPRAALRQDEVGELANAMVSSNRTAAANRTSSVDGSAARSARATGLREWSARRRRGPERWISALTSARSEAVAPQTRRTAGVR